MSSLIFQNKVKNWVILDNKIKEETEKIKELKDQKAELNCEIIDYVKNNDLLKANIELNDSHLKFVTNRVTQSITLKYLENCLNNLIKDTDNVNKIMNYIKENRENKLITEIKRIRK